MHPCTPFVDTLNFCSVRSGICFYDINKLLGMHVQ